jgi:hypothetical protein
MTNDAANCQGLGAMLSELRKMGQISRKGSYVNFGNRLGIIRTAISGPATMFIIELSSLRCQLE